MSERSTTSRSIGSFLKDELKQLARSQQRNTNFPLEVALRSGRISEHRQAASYLARLGGQQSQADAIVRGLLLLQALEELAKQCPQVLDCRLDQLAEGEGK
jgi:hypothetical protein